MGVSHQPARKRVLFLCTGNSCRSQLAEAIVNARLADQWEAFSAGTHPAGFVHPIVPQVLAEIGIDSRGAKSKSIDEVLSVDFDLVVTVCDQAAEECPMWLGRGRRIHVGFPDPAKATGSDEGILGAFRGVRDSIEQEVLSILRSR
jgi:arsenate reductase